MRVVRVIGAPSPIAWWYPAIGQVSQVLDTYKPTGYLCVRLMLPITEYDWLVQKPYDRYRQVTGWIDPQFVEEVI